MALHNKAKTILHSLFTSWSNRKQVAGDSRRVLILMYPSVRSETFFRFTSVAPTDATQNHRREPASKRRITKATHLTTPSIGNMDVYSRAPVPICEEVTPVNIRKEPRTAAAGFLEDSTPQGSTHALFVCICFHVDIEQTNQNKFLLLFLQV